MEKIQLHSKFTFFRKYVLSIWILFAGFFILYSTILNKNWIALIVILLVINGIVYSARKFLFPLRKVFIDKLNKNILVEYKNELVKISLSEIDKIEEQSRLGKILSVKLKSKSEFGNEFIFIPKDNKVIREILESKNNL